MSRRAAHDPGFGSDSFLDVLANMVGILIILIVIAGVRMVHPLRPSSPAAPPEVADPIALAPADTEPHPPQPLDEPLPDEPPEELARSLRAIDAELAALQRKQRDSEAALDQLDAQQAAAQSDADAAQAESSRDRKRATQRQARVTRLEQSLGDRKQELSGLLAEFEEARSARAPVVQVKHRLTPVSQEVDGEEVHFRLTGNRVSVIPLDLLVERVKVQLERQKDWLARHTRHQGSVGPIDGYRLQYSVERQQLSPLEERKLGYGAFRVAVSSWEVVPEKNAPSESLDEALRRGSRFAAALQAAPERAVLTFWVYPDSFALYRRLQAASHAEGFVVAARPLPEGAAIAGSPHGTRSAGQ